MDIKNLTYGTPLVCNYCGKEFIRSREHPGIRYCSVTCQKDAQKKKYLEKRNEIDKNSTSRIHICAYCGKEFHYDTQKNGQKYCSEECKRKSNRKINTESEDEVADVVRYLITKMKQASASDMSVLTIHTEKLNPTEHQRILVLRRDKNRCRVCNSRSKETLINSALPV